VAPELAGDEMSRSDASTRKSRSRSGGRTAAPGETPPPRRLAGILRPKGNLSRTELSLLGILALLPQLSIVLRIMALPGAENPWMGGLRAIGTVLNQMFSLTAVPSDQRAHILYLLFLPTCALLVALARLTLGIRVLGFRSILIAVGFHQSGILPSLLLIVVAVGTIVTVRPWLRRIRLPYYARVSVILCIVATTMVGALLAGPWMRSEVLWGVAYFPVIVLGMLAEGIAHTLDRDNIVTASWRAITTVVLAFIIALVCRVPALGDVLLQFPELVLSQIVAIILVAEFLDLRLFENWDMKVAGLALPQLLAREGAYRVAVVRNRLDTGIIGRLGRRTPAKERRRSVQPIVDALREAGHTVKVLEGDTTLLQELRRFLPPNPQTGEPGGIALNLSVGLQGNARTTHVPGMLEMSGIAYTGPTPQGHAAMQDGVVTRTLLQRAGVPVAHFRLMTSPKDRDKGLRYPLAVRPRYEPGARAQIVQDRDQLQSAVKAVLRKSRHEALVEEHVPGRRLHVALVGNDPLECLPLVELDPKNRRRICPARVDDVLAERIREYARAAFWACGCRDYARVDIRVGRLGQAAVVGVRSTGLLARGGSLARAAAEVGWSFPQLLSRIVEAARTRYLTGEIAKPLSLRPERRLRIDPLFEPRGAGARGRDARRRAGPPPEDPGAQIVPLP
jgi:D-alanine-D-alanine ligase